MMFVPPLVVAFADQRILRLCQSKVKTYLILSFFASLREIDLIHAKTRRKPLQTRQ